ncbi:dihydrodipicolinate synthase family protein [Halorarius halobius]|uniref:dihydrodipicolinate synthase family protein n=1 Tax=Halorarius halobius TaxID=2962671 RepID=UPI0020CEC82B|nr:dihydrodipicolinate synthase family protein [Halorarius halobius]
MLSVEGVIPASLVPFKEDQTIHQEGYQDHIRELASNDRIDGILSNGHAGESYALTSNERAKIVSLAKDASKDTEIYSGVSGSTTGEVIDDAVNVQEAGADAVMVDPPATPITGRPRAAIQFYQEVTNAVDVPVVLFQTSAASGQNYAPDLLAELATIDGIVAIKEGVWDVDHTQDDIVALREQGIDVNYLMGNDEHLLPCYAFGVDGTVVELAAAVPEYICDLYSSVRSGELQRAQEIHQQLMPLLDVIYQDPKHDSSIRLKKLLELQGRLPTSIPRKPALPIPEAETEQIKNELERLGLL